jgi:preprotein translocase subunit SecD
VKERLAIVVSDKAMSVPLVQSPIPGGRVSISMHGHDDRAVAEARRLAVALRGKPR